MPRPTWSDGDPVTQADFDSMRERDDRYAEALRCIKSGEDPDYPGSLMTLHMAQAIARKAINPN